MARTLALISALLIFGCASSDPSPVPGAVAPPGAAGSETTAYVGMLFHVSPGLGQPTGWQLRNENAPGGVPVDVTKVAVKAKALAGQKVVLTAHSAITPGGQSVMVAEKLTAFQPPLPAQ